MKLFCVPFESILYFVCLVSFQMSFVGPNSVCVQQRSFLFCYKDIRLLCLFSFLYIILKRECADRKQRKYVPISKHTRLTAEALLQKANIQFCSGV